MTTTFDTLFAQLASDLTGLFASTSGSIVRDATVENSLTGALTGSVTTYSVLCSPPFPYEEAAVDGSNILRSDAQVVLPYANIPSGMGVPEPKTDRLVVANDASGSYRIISVSPLRSGDNVAAYVLQIRR